MEYMDQLAAGVMGNLQFVILGMTAMLFLALIIFININVKLVKISRRYAKMMKGMDGVNLEALLFKYLEEVNRTSVKIEELNKDCRRLEEIGKISVQQVGVVRFNAFEDTGSDLSFAIALLDGNNNGVVISSIFGRSDSRTYAKPVVDGQSTYVLSDEEIEALRQASKNK
jgi:hypothetical protein